MPRRNLHALEFGKAPLSPRIDFKPVGVSEERTLETQPRKARQDRKTDDRPIRSEGPPPPQKKNDLGE